ncbi:MAG: hypothetical protein ACYCW6_09480 [Candidatus Xenobia bacterium]
MIVAASQGREKAHRPVIVPPHPRAARTNAAAARQRRHTGYEASSFQRARSSTSRSSEAR